MGARACPDRNLNPKPTPNAGPNPNLHSRPTPRRLYELLENESPTVVLWAEDGASFKVNDAQTFCQQVLPKYFRHCKLTSFQRQLNLYGFNHITKGNNAGAYLHHMFLRGRPDLLESIKRTGRKGNNSAAATAAAMAPPPPQNTSPMGVPVYVSPSSRQQSGDSGMSQSAPGPGFGGSGVTPNFSWNAESGTGQFADDLAGELEGTGFDTAGSLPFGSQFDGGGGGGSGIRPRSSSQGMGMGGGGGGRGGSGIRMRRTNSIVSEGMQSEDWGDLQGVPDLEGFDIEVRARRE